MTTDKKSFETFTFSGMALDPIHAGTGGTRLGRVDNTIVRDPVTRIPKIPGSSLAGVMRAYTAMAKGKYPSCAGQGGGDSGHCGQADCPVCTVFGFANGRDSRGGFAGLAGFSDMHVLLFPVATQNGPRWVTSPEAMRFTGVDISVEDENSIYAEKEVQAQLYLGWLALPVKKHDHWDGFNNTLKKLNLPGYMQSKVLLVSDKLFTHIVNSNLEVRTSVAIEPATGSAKDGALFTYEALPRGTVLVWEMTCRNPEHFKINGQDVTAVYSPGDVKNVVAAAHPYLEHLGIGGMGSRGMGRLRVLQTKEPAEVDTPGKEAS